MIGSLTGSTTRKNAFRAAIALAGLAATFATTTPAHAATGRVAGPVSSTASPQNTVFGSNGWVDMLAENAGSLIYVGADVASPGNILYSYGHWQILTPLQQYNTQDGTYQAFGGYFAHATGNYCARWWYRDALGNYTDEGFPCVWVN